MVVVVVVVVVVVIAVRTMPTPPAQHHTTPAPPHHTTPTRPAPHHSRPRRTMPATWGGHRPQPLRDNKLWPTNPRHRQITFPHPSLPSLKTLHILPILGTDDACKCSIQAKIFGFRYPSRSAGGWQEDRQSKGRGWRGRHGNVNYKSFDGQVCGKGAQDWRRRGCEELRRPVCGKGPAGGCSKGAAVTSTRSPQSYIMPEPAR